MADLPVLHQFRSSHFNEKARWALDWKGIPHRRVSYLPGPHAPQIQRLSGQPSTPVLAIDGDVIAGTARILERLDARHPEKPLAPVDPEQRRLALEFERDFDEEVGPAVRTAIFSVIIDEPGFVSRMFAGHTGPVKRAAYRAIFPIVRGTIAKAHETDRPERVVRAFEVTRAALDRVAKQINAQGQLFGEHFTSADLTAAALFAPLVNPTHPDMAKPEPIPASVEAFMAQWADHEVAHWVLAQYARHRPASAAV